jgi:amino acid adenylation domain-containing protein
MVFLGGKMENTRSILERIGDLPPEKRELLEKLLRAKALADAPQTSERGESGTFPLSFGQQRMWFMDQWVSGSALFNLHAAIRVEISLQELVLERCLNEIVRRHESLRTTFVVTGGQPMQVIAPQLRLALPVVDLAELPVSEREAEMRRQVAEEAERPFDLSRGPLVRTTLLRMGRLDHVFLMVIHHIVSDGWSMEVFFQELTALYEAFAAGRPSPLPELPLQYVDYAIWQRQWLQGEILQDQVRYWKEQLAGAPVLQLQTDRVRPALQSFAGSHHSFTLALPLVRALKALSHEEGATLFMTLLAGFCALLCRYSDQEDIVVGSYVAGRNRADLEKLIGFFINTIVLRVDASGNPPFREILKRVRKMALEAYAHQDLPFARLVEELQPERDLSRNPLFQVVFQLLNIPGAIPAPTGGPKPLHQEVQRRTTIVDLTCTLWETTEGISGDIEYNTDLFDAATVKRLVAHYEVLLEGIVAEADKRIRQLPLLTKSEQRQILIEWNGSQREDGQEVSLMEIFEGQAEARPTAVAFRCEGQELCFEELNRRSNQLAHYLQELGVGPEVVVGICLRRGLSLVIALLGVLKAGGAYLPLDPDYPSERLTFMARDAGIKVLLTEQRVGNELPCDEAKVVYLDREEASIREHCAHNPKVSTSSNHLAYLLYTSGSTGQPKGIAVEGRQILNRLRWMWEAYPFEAHEVGCQKTALNFVDSLWELLGMLLQGLPTVIIPTEVVRDPVALVNILEQHQVSRIWLVPSLLRTLLDQYPDLELRLPKLRFWVSSGEALSWDLFQRFQETMPQATLYNLYGTTEVWDATWFDPHLERVKDGQVPIGRAIRNVELYVLDPYQQAVPVGIPGELYVGGQGLARHYLNLPGLTREKFVPHLFRSVPGVRLYRTGDLVRYLPDGNLEFLGRMDQQLKIRGFQVEPAEIEALLRRQEAVQEGVVVGRKDSYGDTQLVAYCVPQPGRSLASTELRQYMKAWLPEYMVPSFFVLLEQLPLLPNGKVDRAALPAPNQMRPELEHAYVAPRTQIEEALAEMYADVLGLKQVGIYDNFFAHLGGHSLLGTQLLSRVRKRFRIELSIRSFFQNPTVSQLAEAICPMLQDQTIVSQNSTEFDEGEL